MDWTLHDMIMGFVFSLDFSFVAFFFFSQPTNIC